MRFFLSFLIFYVTSGLFSSPVFSYSQFSDADINLAFDIGIPGIDKAAESNGFILGYSQVSRDFYLFKKTNGEWEFDKSFDLDVGLPNDAEIFSLSNEKLAVVTLTGHFLEFEVEANGNVNITSTELTAIDNPFPPQRTNFDLQINYTVHNERLVVTAGIQKKATYVFDLAQTSAPILISKIDLPEDIGFIRNIAANDISIWVVTYSVIYHLKLLDEQYDLVGRIESPDGDYFGAAEVTEHWLLVSRLGKGFYFADISSTEQNELMVVENPDFRPEGSVESIQGILQITEDSYIFSYFSDIVFVRMSSPREASRITGLYLINASQTYFFNNQLVIARGSLGFAHLEVASHIYPTALARYNSQLFHFAAINVIGEEIIASKYGNNGLIRFKSNEVHDLANNENRELDESHTLFAQSPRCFAKNGEYIY